MTRIIFFLTLFITQSMFSAFAGKQDSILANVGNDIIPVELFVKTYTEIRSRTGLQDNLSNREKVLDELIKDKILLHLAKERRINEENSSKTELLRIETQILLNAFSESIISSRIDITENDLLETFHRMNTQIKISHLYSETREGIDTIYNKLQNGVSFESLAQSVFNDPVLKANKGSLGYFSYDELVPEIENTAFGMMVGEISKPIKTVYGFSIIRLEDKRTMPLLTEQNFIQKKNELYTITRRRKSQEQFKYFADSVRYSLNITFNKSIVNKLLQMIVKQQNVWSDDLSSAHLPEGFNADPVIVTVGNEKWKYSKFVASSALTSPQQKSFIRSMENIEDYIYGLIIRDKILTAAKSLKMHQTKSYTGRVNQLYDEYLVKQITSRLKNESRITEQEIADYYKYNENKYLLPEQWRLSSILLETDSSIKIISDRLQSGDDFGSLAQKYSSQLTTAERSGDIGYFSLKELGELSGIIEKISAGEITGPIFNERKYLFLKCTDKRESVKLSLKEVKESIIEELQGLKLQQSINVFVGEYYKILNVTINYEKLKSVL